MKINILHRFKKFPFVVCATDGLLYQLENCPRKRTIPFKKLTYNEKRDAYRINSQWVTRKQLQKLKII